MITMERSRLYEREVALGATFGEQSGWEVPTAYGDWMHEYQAARQAVAVRDRSPVGRIVVTGDDRFDFFQRMSTNDMRNLKPGTGLPTILTSPVGRIVDYVVLYVQPESLLMLTSPENRVKDVRWLRSYIFFRDKVKLQDVTTETGLLTVYGPHSELLLRAAFGDQPLGELPMYYYLTVQLAGQAVHIARAEGLDGPAFNLWSAAEVLPHVWDRLFTVGVEYGLQPLGERAHAVLRVEAGVPEAGRELTEEINPHEARLLRAVSFSKGCYIGQEVIARLDTYHKVQKYLVGLLPERPLAPGMRLVVDGKDVGWVTSVVDSPALGRPIALGYVRTAYAEAGQVVNAIQDGENISVQVKRLPFEKGVAKKSNYSASG